MKKLLLFLILLSALAIAEDKTIDMKINDNIQIENKNITLIDFNKDDKKAVICINNIKGIVSDEKTVNNVFIDIVSFKEDSIRIRMEAVCEENCECDSSCSNNQCFTEKECILDINCNDNNKFTTDKCINNKCVNERILENKGTQDITISSQNNSNLFILFSIPILILIFIILYLAIKNKN